VTFLQAFALDREVTVPAGVYEVIAEEELLQDLSFPVWRRVATYLVVSSLKGRTEWLSIRPEQLDQALLRDPTATDRHFQGDAALSPRED
jgi:hypothetical protein